MLALNAAMKAAVNSNIGIVLYATPNAATPGVSV
jgi:hypothetical protein